MRLCMLRSNWDSRLAIEYYIVRLNRRGGIQRTALHTAYDLNDAQIFMDDYLNKHPEKERNVWIERAYGSYQRKLLLDSIIEENDC